MAQRYLTNKQINVLRSLCFDALDPHRNYPEEHVMEMTASDIDRINVTISKKKIYELKRIIKDLDEMRKDSA